MSDFEFLILSLGFGGTFLAGILFLIFSWVTVRKLKKNPDTKNALGMEFVSGWNILNTAQALSLPKLITKSFRNSPLSFLHADSELLVKHTSVFDRILARIFYYVFLFSGGTLVVAAILDVSGFL